MNEFSSMVKVLAKSGESIKAEMTARNANLLHMVIGISGESGEWVMNRASPVDMRKALEIVQALKDAGILFVPIPVLNEAQQVHLNKILHDALMEIERQNSLCECKARDRKYCEGEWEQDCDLGKNEKFATPAPDA